MSDLFLTLIHNPIKNINGDKLMDSNPAQARSWVISLRGGPPGGGGANRKKISTEFTSVLTKPVAQPAQMAREGWTLPDAKGVGFGEGGYCTLSQRIFFIIGYEMVHFSVECDVKTWKIYCASASWKMLKWHKNMNVTDVIRFWSTLMGESTDAWSYI